MKVEKTRSALSEDLNLLQRLNRVGIALSAERNLSQLLEMIVHEAKSIANADGCTLYLRNNEDETLEFSIIHTSSLGIHLNRSEDKGSDFKPISLYDPDTQAPNYGTQAVYAVLMGQSVNIPDVYAAGRGFDFQGTQRFDKHHNYRTRSVLSIPMKNYDQEVIGALQLVNAQDPQTGEVIPFGYDVQLILESVASQAAVAIDNQQLLDGQKRLLEAFIKVMARAIDEKSPYTGKHCERVPVITEMLADAACEDTGPFKDFSLNDKEKYELHIAGWLHDCGKVTTPVHIMDKATKLETIYDRIDLIDTRFEVLKRDAEIACLKALQKPQADKNQLERELKNTLQNLDEEYEFIRKANIGGEFMDDEDIERIEEIASKHWQKNGENVAFLSDNEIYNLSVRKGTLTMEERQIINDHMVVTISMLNQLPFPKYLQRVPEYAGGHHERMDGKGYPQGLKGNEMSIPARIMAIADVFEALTATDRPYKKPKKLSETIRIMGNMKKGNHLDPDLLDLFIRSKTYLKFAHKYLDSEQIDEVDESLILGITPDPMN